MHYFPSQIAPAIINLIIIMILTRVFTLEKYGDYVLITTIITFLVTIFTQWLMQSILYFRPKYKENNELNKFDNYITSIINKFIVINVLFLLILIVAKSFFGIETVYIFGLMIVLVQSVFTLEQVILQSDMQTSTYAKRIFVSNLIRLLGITFLVITQINLNLVLLVILLSYGFLIAPNFNRYFKRNLKWNPDVTLFFKNTLTYGLPMLGWFLCVSIINVIDRLLIDYYHGSEHVGLFAGNFSIIQSALGLVFIPLTMVIHPVIMKYAVNIKENKDFIEKLISKFTTIYFIVGVPIIILVYQFRKEIAHIFLGEQYVIASDLIPIVMVGIFFWNLAMVGHKGMEIINKTKIMFYFALITCSISIMSNIILIREFSYLGAATGNMIAFSCYCILVYCYSLKSIKWLINLKEICYTLITGAFIFLILSTFEVDIIDQGIFESAILIVLLSLLILVIYGTIIFMMMKLKLINIKF